MRQVPTSSKDPIYEFTLRIKLIFRLLKDRKVPSRLKILTFLGVFYLFLPFKMFFPFDFLLMLCLGGYLFIELSPQTIVAATLKDLRNVIPGEFKKENHKVDSRRLDKRENPENTPNEKATEDLNRSSSDTQDLK